MLLLPLLVAAQVQAATPVVTSPATARPNDNRVSAGRLKNGVLALDLDIRQAVWHPEGPNRIGIPVYAFAERGRDASIPGPLLRVPAGTELRLTITNMIPKLVRVPGLQDHTTAQLDMVDVASGATRELQFRADVPGTYFYWARTEGDLNGILESKDSQLHGAFMQFAYDWDWNEGRRTLNHAIALDPIALWPLVILGGVYTFAGCYPEAIASFHDALELNPAHHESLRLLGWAELCRGRPEAAIPWLERAVDLSRRVPLHLSNLAQASAPAGRMNEATLLVREILAAHDAGVPQWVPRRARAARRRPSGRRLRVARACRRCARVDHDDDGREPRLRSLQCGSAIPRAPAVDRQSGVRRRS